MPNLPIKILIVDDHPIFRHGMRGLLETQTSFRVMAEARSAKEAWSLLEKTEIDLVLLDINMPGTDGIELASRLRARYARLLILMVTMHKEDAYIRRSIAAGANGYVIKDAESRDIFKAIRAVAGGNRIFPDKYQPEPDLTLSEKRVLWLTGHHKYDTARIAARMEIVEATVNTHRHNIWQKLKAVLPEEETSNPNLLVILGVEYRFRCPEYPSE
jgi:DNA-binding NarL/FixJ family response regulator